MLRKPDSIGLYITYIVTTILSILVYFFIPKYLSPLFAITCVFVTIWVSRWLYDSPRILVDIFPLFLSSSLLSYPITYIYRYFVVEREKRVILKTFSHYVSPKIVRTIDLNNIEATLGGEKKELSIFFSDIAGFTTLSEQMDTKELFLMMTTYLSRMTNILTKEGGTLDKYIGDAIMGFYGAPVFDQEHAIHACNTAILMREELV